MSPALDESNPRDLASDVTLDEDTARFVFIAKSSGGKLFSMPLVRDGEADGTAETRLLAEYLAVVSDRTGRTREALVRELVTRVCIFP